MEAIVLAGGLGTRLRSIVHDVPKPMAPVNGRPFLAFVLDTLVQAGFSRAILAVGYRHEAIRTYFGDTYGKLALIYSVESEPLGTGGAIQLACRHLESDDDVLVLNGDTFVQVDYRAMLDAHRRARAELTIAAVRVADAGRYGAMEVSDGMVRAFHEKDGSGPGWINGGAYLMGSALRARFPPERPFSFEHEILMPAPETMRILAFPLNGIFIDIGVPADYARAQATLRTPRAS